MIEPCAICHVDHHEPGAPKCKALLPMWSPARQLQQDGVSVDVARLRVVAQVQTR